MALSPSQMKEITGPVVNVDHNMDERDPVPVPAPSVVPPSTLNLNGAGSAGASSLYKKSPRKATVHQIVSGGGDEHRVLTTPSGHVLREHGGDFKRHPPKFSSIMNEYVGACFEENCNIGKDI